MVNFSLNAKNRTCDIYVEQRYVETCPAFPIEAREARLKAHGWQPAKPSRSRAERQAANGYGWSKSAGIRRGTA